MGRIEIYNIYLRIVENHQFCQRIVENVRILSKDRRKYTNFIKRLENKCKFLNEGKKLIGKKTEQISSNNGKKHDFRKTPQNERKIHKRISIKP